MGPADGAAFVTFAPGADPAGIEVPLVRRDGDPSAYVEARIGEEVPAFARIELAPGAVVRVGRILAIRAGLPERRGGTRTTVPWLRVGELLLNDVEAELSSGEELALGVDALSELGVAVLPSRGVVRFFEDAGGPGPAGELPGEGEAPLTDVIRFADGRVETSPAPRPAWTDADEVRRAWLEAEVSRWPAPEARAPAPEGDPGDLLGRLRWAELAEARFATGDLPGAVEADHQLLLVAGDRCELVLAAGERLLRAGDASGPEVVARARALEERWAALEPAERELVRGGRTLRGQLSIVQPDECGRAALLLLGEGAWGEPFPTARWGLDVGSEAALRWAVAGGAEPPAARLVLAALARRTGREELVSAQVAALAADDPHPLTSALWLAEHLGPGALLDREDLAARGVLGLASVEELERALALRPSDALACALAAAGAPDPEALARPEADCLAASVLVARRGGDARAEARSLDALRIRWPDAWPEPP